MVGCADVDEGEEGAGEVSISGIPVSTFPFAACIASYNIGKSGCVLWGSTWREEGGGVGVGSAPMTFFKSLANSATDW
jgi:hypothetical protein